MDEECVGRKAGAIRRGLAYMRRGLWEGIGEKICLEEFSIDVETFRIIASYGGESMSKVMQVLKVS